MKAENTFFSVIIPTYNRPYQLHNCLEAISRLNFPKDRFEVIVVDDSGKYSLKPFSEAFQDLLDIKMIRTGHGGPARARNIGASKATGEYLVFTDDDCEPSHDWLKNISARFLKMPNHTIGGKIINGLPDNIYSSTSQFLISYLYEYFKTVTDYMRFFTSNNLAVPARQFHAIGGFDEITFLSAAGEDRDFCYRWLRKGFPMTYDPGIVIYHYHRLNFLTFMHQHFNYGRAAFRFNNARKSLDNKPVRFKPISFYIKMLRFPSMYAQNSTIRIQALLVLSQAFNALGYFIEKFNYLKHLFYP